MMTHLASSSGWRPSSNDRLDRAWPSFKIFLDAPPVPINSAPLKSILKYLAFLKKQGYSYSTNNVHRCVISSTMSLIGGDAVGSHPTFFYLRRGVFNGRPPFVVSVPSWDASKIFELFANWPSPVFDSCLIKKTAFLLAIAAPKRPSQLASLKMSPTCLSMDHRQNLSLHVWERRIGSTSCLLPCGLSHGRP